MAAKAETVVGTDPFKDGAGLGKLARAFRLRCVSRAAEQPKGNENEETRFS